MDESSSDGIVVLVRDASWPSSPGVRQWRTGLRETFEALGCEVREVAWTPPVIEEGVRPGATADAGPEAPAARPPSVPRTVLRIGARTGRAVGYGAWWIGRLIARPVVRPVAAALDERRRTRESHPNGRVAGPDGANGSSDAVDENDQVEAIARATATCRLVVAETPGAAETAGRAGVPAGRIWLLAVPPERAAAGEPTPWASGLRAVVPDIAGLVADSLDAAGVLERVAGPVHTVVLPPLAYDRETPVDSGDGTDGADGTDGDERVDPTPTDVPGHLALWRSELARFAAGKVEAGARAYAYPIARLVPDPLDPSEGAQGWTVAAQQAGARALLGRTPPRAEPRNPLRVRVFGPDPTYVRDLADALDQRPELEVVLDEWRDAVARNNGITENLARTGQVLVAEWARQNAIWLSEAKRSDQRLVVRLHRPELDSPYPARIRTGALDAIVVEAPEVARAAVEELGWPAERIVHIPGYVDTAALDRPKYPGARFTLGMVGIAPAAKRFDLALDLLAAVRATDPRFSLIVRSPMGWSDKVTWDRPAERARLQRCLERVDKDPLLRGAVVLDPYGRDMAAWYRKVGQILSLSDDEGWHQALADGMASGAVPVVRDWPGAAGVFGAEWVVGGVGAGGGPEGSVDAAVERVLAWGDEERWAADSARVRRGVRERFDPAKVVEAWTSVLQGDLARARAYFSQT